MAGKRESCYLTWRQPLRPRCQPHVVQDARRIRHFSTTSLQIFVKAPLLPNLCFSLPSKHHEPSPRRTHPPHHRMSVPPPHPFHPHTNNPPVLDPSSIVALQHVSHHFLSLSRDNNLWKTLCYNHSASEQRRRRLASTASTDPRLAELVRAADALSDSIDTSVHDPNAPSAEVQIAKNKGKREKVLLANWDPSYPGEKVNWYREFVQRHAQPKVGWFQDAGRQIDEADGVVRREATGAGVLFDAWGEAEKLVAPMEDGRVCIWDARGRSETQGRMVAKSEVGMLAGKGQDLDMDTRLTQSRAVMTETGAVECVSVDSTLKKGYFAVQNMLNEVDLNTLQIVSRTPYPFPVTALSEAHHSTPLTVGTNWTIHLHDARKPPSTTRCELIAGSTDTSFSALTSSPSLGSHVSLSQPGALSILHLPSTRSPDGNGDIWLAGRFTSMLNFDRRYFPRLRGTLHSGARLSCITALPYPFIPHSLRLGHPYSSPRVLHDAKALDGYTLVAAGEYKGKGSLELYGLSGEPERSVNSSDARTTRNQQAVYQNRQTASRSKLLSVAAHGTRLVLSDGDGGVKWVERDASTAVRGLNVNDFQPGQPATTMQHAGLVAQEGVETGWGDIVQKILPTVSPSLFIPHHSSSTSSSAASSVGVKQDNLILWTGEGKLGLLGFGESPIAEDVFEDALETQGVGEKVRERQYGVEMRRALEMQARELRWLRGYGL